ncbi:pentapeptide repeat-containing protein [Adhaeribacter soli]|uniref:Pentapeptide repeat-containing protein n=1 Tax=Adhaeribacter soli TaxID=2607655 RepID=A0A5N1IUJ1_9BACT|nr:pentapeptide repeat-containing protein [Adhaeribacter soli]KAA9332776.1 pentapeptide repeat-containing protein [Adhaeribacter soli]
MNDSGRIKIEDKIINSNLDSTDFHNKHFVRIGSKDQNFKKINFSHTYFENCYFRNIVFDSCNFNGCKFINCNFQGSTFPGSRFEYATFEKTFIDSEILDNNCPSWNNLTLKFARTLRTNYQGIGEAESVNKAIKIELQATKEHLYESWKSKSAYYRNKYKGFDRLKMFFKWLNFKIQDIIWGNGESPIKLFSTGLFLWILISILDTLFYKDPKILPNYVSSFCEVPSIFMGINKPADYPNLHLTLITIIRFIGFALFTSIIIKRFNRR